MQLIQHVLGFQQINEVTVGYCKGDFRLFVSSQRFTTIPNSGATKTSSILLEVRRDLTNKKPSYRLIGT